jgi:hypothetical protein
MLAEAGDRASSAPGCNAVLSPARVRLRREFLVYWQFLSQGQRRWLAALLYLAQRMHTCTQDWLEQAETRPDKRQERDLWGSEIPLTRLPSAR